MWVPESDEQIRAAAAARTLAETQTFDAKLLPDRNRDIAIDIAAMTTDGGVLLYGVGEDEHGHPTLPAPFQLAGQAERIDQIAQTSISEPPVIYVHRILAPTDPAVGYIAVEVPLSPRAPHQVTVGDDRRYYGRAATGNRRLSEREVADLYERRRRWELDRDAVLTAVVEQSPPSTAERGYLHTFARPVVRDDGLLERVIAADGDLANRLVRAAHETSPAGAYRPAVAELRGWSRHGADGIAPAAELGHEDAMITLLVSHHGDATLHCVAARRLPDGPLRLFEYLIAGNLSALLAIAAAVYGQAGYLGPVDVGVALTGIQGGVSDFLGHHSMHGGSPFPGAEYRSTDRVLARQLLDQPREVARRLLFRFMTGVAGPEFDPFQ